MVGIYARDVPDDIPAIEPQLFEANLLPVAEGSRSARASGYI